jgi:hypothetical protein
LIFSLKEGQTQEINQYGMRKLNDKVTKDENLASFRITITKAKEEFVLQGFDGTSWKELRFSCKKKECRPIIDQNGVRFAEHK